MNTALWIVQGLLSTMFLMAGVMKSMQPIEKLSKMSWTTRSSIGKIRFIGISELLIGLGLVLPWLTSLMPILTPIAAIALVIIMILAIADHAKHKETKEIGMNAFILLLAAFVAFGRFTF